jgi:hypothetical protein
MRPTVFGCRSAIIGPSPPRRTHCRQLLGFSVTQGPSIKGPKIYKNLYKARDDEEQAKGEEREEKRRKRREKEEEKGRERKRKRNENQLHGNFRHSYGGDLLHWLHFMVSLLFNLTRSYSFCKRGIFFALANLPAYQFAFQRFPFNKAEPIEEIRTITGNHGKLSIWHDYPLFFRFLL